MFWTDSELREEIVRLNKKIDILEMHLRDSEEEKQEIKNKYKLSQEDYKVEFERREYYKNLSNNYYAELQIVNKYRPYADVLIRLLKDNFTNI